MRERRKWMTSEVKRVSEVKNKLFRLCTRTRRLIDWEKYSCQRKKTTEPCKKAKLDSERELK